MRIFFKSTAIMLGTVFALVLLVIECGAVAIGAAVLSTDVGESANAPAITQPLRIVIDPGHGGRDNGVSVGELHEADLAMAISLKLASELELSGVEVTLTRDGEVGLYDNDAPNRKRDDMRRRHQIIEMTKPDLVLSIHMNSFPADKSVHGLQCFYHVKADGGKVLAEHIQEALNATEQFGRGKRARPGDYYILETEFPSVIIECGFITNPDDARKLSTEEHQRTLAREIAKAVVSSLRDTTPHVV